MATTAQSSAVQDPPPVADGETTALPGTQLPEKYKPQGYHKLAVLMGTLCDEAAIFRRFGALNMVNLLSLQAELVALQVDFQDICHEDDHSNDPTDRLFSSCFRTLRNSNGAVNDEQWQKLLVIRRKLSEYSTPFPG